MSHYFFHYHQHVNPLLSLSLSNSLSLGVFFSSILFYRIFGRRRFGLIATKKQHQRLEHQKKTNGTEEPPTTKDCPWKKQNDQSDCQLLATATATDPADDHSTSSSFFIHNKDELLLAHDLHHRYQDHKILDDSEDQSEHSQPTEEDQRREIAEQTNPQPHESELTHEKIPCSLYHYYDDEKAAANHDELKLHPFQSPPIVSEGYAEEEQDRGECTTNESTPTKQGEQEKETENEEERAWSQQKRMKPLVLNVMKVLMTDYPRTIHHNIHHNVSDCVDGVAEKVSSLRNHLSPPISPPLEVIADPLDETPSPFATKSGFRSISHELVEIESDYDSSLEMLEIEKEQKEEEKRREDLVESPFHSERALVVSRSASTTDESAAMEQDQKEGEVPLREDIVCGSDDGESSSLSLRTLSSSDENYEEIAAILNSFNPPPLHDRPSSSCSSSQQSTETKQERKQRHRMTMKGLMKRFGSLFPATSSSRSNSNRPSFSESVTGSQASFSSHRSSISSNVEDEESTNDGDDAVSWNSDGDDTSKHDRRRPSKRFSSTFFSFKKKECHDHDDSKNPSNKRRRSSFRSFLNMWSYLRTWINTKPTT